MLASISLRTERSADKAFNSSVEWYLASSQAIVERKKRFGSLSSYITGKVLIYDMQNKNGM